MRPSRTASPNGRSRRSLCSCRFLAYNRGVWTIEALQQLDPTEFELLVGRLFEGQGFGVQTTPKTRDHGVDLRLSQLGRKYIVQCKRYQGSVGEPALREFYGTMLHEGSSLGYFVTTGSVTQQARLWASGKNILILDSSDLLTALNQFQPSQSADWPTFAERLDRVVHSRSPFSFAVVGVPPMGHNPRKFFAAIAGKLGVGSNWGSVVSSREFSVASTRLSGVPEIAPELVLIDCVEELSPSDEDQFFDLVDTRNRTGLITFGWVWNPSQLNPRLKSAFDLAIDASAIDWELIKNWSDSPLAKLTGRILEERRPFVTLPLHAPDDSPSILVALGLTGETPSLEPRTLALSYYNRCNQWLLRGLSDSGQGVGSGLEGRGPHLWADLLSLQGLLQTIVVRWRDEIGEFYAASAPPNLPGVALPEKAEDLLRRRLQNATRSAALEDARQRSLERRQAKLANLSAKWQSEISEPTPGFRGRLKRLLLRLQFLLNGGTLPVNPEKNEPDRNAARR